MPINTSSEPATEPRSRVITALSFFAIYIIWGSTFLAIRIAVATVPPLFAAGIRFVLAGGVLYAWARLRRNPSPTRIEWRSIGILSVFLFLIAYGGVFWAEKTVPSGIVSVLVATIPVWTAVLQIAVFKKESFRWSLLIGIACGLFGVTVLAFDPSAKLNLSACLAVLFSEVSWSTGTVLSKILPVPKSMLINSGAQMLSGGLMLLAGSAIFGEWRPFPHIGISAGLAILYLAIAGSIIAFTAYIWLLKHMPATVVTSYAYVNPVVALIVGHWLGSEALGIKTVVGATLVLLSVLVVLFGNSKRSRRKTQT